jgi:hypothetical protein
VVETWGRVEERLPQRMQSALWPGLLGFVVLLQFLQALR